MLRVKWAETLQNVKSWMSCSDLTTWVSTSLLASAMTTRWHALFYDFIIYVQLSRQFLFYNIIHQNRNTGTLTLLPSQRTLKTVNLTALSASPDYTVGIGTSSMFPWYFFVTKDLNNKRSWGRLRRTTTKFRETSVEIWIFIAREDSLSAIFATCRKTNFTRRWESRVTRCHSLWCM